MIRIGIAGSHLIHTYAYSAQLNEPDYQKLEQARHVSPWQRKLLEKMHSCKSTAYDNKARFTAICGDPNEVCQEMAQVFSLDIIDDITKLAKSVDLIMVLDEDAKSRYQLTRQIIEAGCAVFVDKTIAPDVDSAQELIDLADKNGISLSSWSQMGFAPELDAVRKVVTGGEGGTVLLTAGMPPFSANTHAIHLVSVLHGCLGAGVVSKQSLLEGDQHVMALLQHKNGAQIVIAFAEHYPPVQRIDYMVNEKSVVAEAHDRITAFSRSVKQALDTLNTPAAHEPQRMLETIGLVHYFEELAQSK